MPPVARRFLPDLARLCARRFWRLPGIGALSTHPALPAARLVGARSGLAVGHTGRRLIASPLLPGRVTVRPNKSFKPTPLRSGTRHGRKSLPCLAPALRSAA
jgi:hypothetical protein